MILWREERGGYRARLWLGTEALLSLVITLIFLVVLFLDKRLLIGLPLVFTVCLAVASVWFLLAAFSSRSPEWVFITLDGKAAWSGGHGATATMDPVLISRFILDCFPTGHFTANGYRLTAVLPSGERHLPYGDYWTSSPKPLEALVRHLNELVGVDPTETAAQLLEVEDKYRGAPLQGDFIRFLVWLLIIATVVGVVVLFTVRT